VNIGALRDGASKIMEAGYVQILGRDTERNVGYSSVR
jgi:hypothetical protein